jgi:hypothetical protein
VAVALPADPPDHVVLALAKVVADVAVADAVQGGEVESFDPGLAHIAADQVGDHLRVAEQQLVSVVVSLRWWAHGFPPPCP